MVRKKKPNPFIDFALSYSGRYSPLSAGVAIARCKALLQDLEKLEEQLPSATTETIGLEIVSYYAVGFATCLEWHARSRVVDSITHDPTSIKAEHFEGISKEVLAQTMRLNLTVAQLFGSLQRISSLDDYNVAFSRHVFGALEIAGSPKALASTATPEERTAVGLQTNENINSIIEDMFQFRHHLVHEISRYIIGGEEDRVVWSTGWAKEYGRACLLLMCKVETAITKNCPTTFPNLLDDQFFPMNDWFVVEDRVEQLQKQIECWLLRSEGPEIVARWKECQEADQRCTIYRHGLMESIILKSPDGVEAPWFELDMLNWNQRIVYLEKVLSYMPERKGKKKPKQVRQP